MLIIACAVLDVWIDIGWSFAASTAIFAVGVAAAQIIAAVLKKRESGETRLVHPAVKASDGDGKSIIDSAIDYLKTTTGLVTGALIFSIAFLLPNATTTCSMHSWLTAASALLALSTACGLLAQSGLIGMLADSTYDLDSPAYVAPAVAHLFTFIAAAVAIALSVVLGDQRPSLDSIAIRNSEQAAAAAVKSFNAANGGGLYRISRVVSADLSKGVDPNDARDLNWHVQFEIQATRKVIQPRNYWDIFLDAASGRVTVVTPSK